MSYVRKMGASALVITAAFAVAFAVLMSATPTVEAQAAPDHTLAAGSTAVSVDNVAPGDTVRIVVESVFAQVSITGTADGVGGSFDANDGQSIACGNGNTCDKDDVPTSVSVDLTVDKDAGEGHILLSVGGLGATPISKVINVNKSTLVGSLTIKAVSKTIAANDDDTVAPTLATPGPNATLISVNVKNAASKPAGLNTQSVTLITTLGTISCNGTDFTQACSVTTDTSVIDTTPGFVSGDDTEPGWATVILRGGGVEGTATVTATLGSLTDTADVTFYGKAKNLSASPEQGSVEIGGSVFVVLTVTDNAGNPVSGLQIAPITTGTTKEIVGPDGVDNPVLVKTEKATTARTGTEDVAGVGYSMDKNAAKAADRIPACGEDNRDINATEGGLQELFASEGTNDKGQCVVHVTAPAAAGSQKAATRGVHTLNFQATGDGVSGTIKASAMIEVAGAPASITTNAAERVDTESSTEITVSVWDDEDVLVGITSVKVRKVGGDGLIEDNAGAKDADGNAIPDTEKTSDGQSKFTLIAPSNPGSIEILITAGKATPHRLTVHFGEEEPEPVPEPEPAPSLNKTPASTGFTLVTFSGGTIEELVAVVTDVCGPSADIYATNLGAYVSYFVGSPDFVNRGFNDLYADGIPAGEALLVGGCGS